MPYVTVQTRDDLPDRERAPRRLGISRPALLRHRRNEPYSHQRREADRRKFPARTIRSVILNTGSVLSGNNVTRYPLSTLMRAERYSPESRVLTRPRKKTENSIRGAVIRPAFWVMELSQPGRPLITPTAGMWRQQLRYSHCHRSVLPKFLLSPNRTILWKSLGMPPLCGWHSATPSYCIPTRC